MTEHKSIITETLRINRPEDPIASTDGKIPEAEIAKTNIIETAPIRPDIDDCRPTDDRRI